MGSMLFYHLSFSILLHLRIMECPNHPSPRDRYRVGRPLPLPCCCPSPVHPSSNNISYVLSRCRMKNLLHWSLLSPRRGIIGTNRCVLVYPYLWGESMLWLIGFLSLSVWPLLFIASNSLCTAARGEARWDRSRCPLSP